MKKMIKKNKVKIKSNRKSKKRKNQINKTKVLLVWKSGGNIGSKNKINF
jgi:hypothetical protein